MQAALHEVIGPKEVHPDNLTGRTAIVLGGAFGIGYEISRALAHAGAKVIMVNRKEEQGADAIDNIKQESPEADIDWKECDIGNLNQVRSVFSSLRDSLDRLDFLVLCAGINAAPFALDADGIDRHFGVNYLGQYYATNQLWPLIRKTSNMPGVTPPRIVSLSSELHKLAPADLKFASFMRSTTTKCRLRTCTAGLSLRCCYSPSMVSSTGSSSRIAMRYMPLPCTLARLTQICRNSGRTPTRA